MACTRSRLVLAVASVALGSACPGGDDAAADESESSSSGSADDPTGNDDAPESSSSGTPADTTTTGDDTTPDDDGDDDTTTGDATSGDTTASDDTTTSGTTDAPTTDGDDSTTSDDTTGGNVLPGGCAESCEPGCTSDLLLGLAGAVEVDHDGTTILGVGDDGRAGLWRASDRALVLSRTEVDAATLAGGIAAFEQNGEIELLDATDGSALATVSATSTWGLADDGSYVWTADAAGLSRWETDGSPSWTLAGNFAGATVLALPAGVHVFAAATADVVHHVDAATGVDDDVAIDGEFGGWFADAPRFWTIDGDTYHLYEPDGSQIAFEFGAPAWGFGDRLALWDDFHSHATIVDVGDPDTPLATIADPQFSGPAAIGLDPAMFTDVVLVQLDDPALVLQPVTPGCCIDGLAAAAFDFAWSDDAWVLGGEAGELFDHAGESVTPGEITSTQGALAGRFVATTVLDRTHVFDVDPECIALDGGSFARTDREAVLSDDGLVLMSMEKPFGGGYTGQLYNRFYDTTTGAMLVEYGPQLSSATWMGGQLSADAALFSSSTISGEIFSSFIATQPDFDGWDSGFWGVVPGIAPDGAHAVRCDAVSGFGATLEGAQSYVVDDSGPLAIIDGVSWGFLANDRVLVGHYVSVDPTCYIPGECDDFVSSEVVDLDGDVVAATTLPETRYFERVSDTEIFASDTFAIWDVYAGELLWQAPAQSVAAAAVGTDFVAITDGAVLTLTKWR